MISLGALIRCHKRARTLDIVLGELRRYNTFTGLQVRVHVMADRPTPEVERILEKHKDIIFNVLTASSPLVSNDGGERFSEALNEQLQDFERCHFDWLVRQDDDEWLEPFHATLEIPRALADPAVDMWYARILFMWDHPNTYNQKRQHLSPYFFRFKRGDRFPTNRIIHATECVHDHALLAGRVNQLKTPILEYGSFDATERLEGFERYLKAGKVDAFTETLIREPVLRRFPEDAHLDGFLPEPLWEDLYSKYLREEAALAR